MAAGLDFDVVADFRRVERMLHGMQTKAVTAAANSALNKTMRTVASVAVKDVSKKIGLTVRDTRRYMTVDNSTRRTLETSLTGSGKRIPVHFRKARQTRRGVTYKGIDGKRRLVKGAFLPGGDPKRGAFKRTGEFREMTKGRYVGKRREAIKFLRTASVPYLMKQRAFEDAINATAVNRWRLLFERELRYYLKRYG